ncbi:hypothetical protein K4F52_008400 [Lecanicillium sp. MT-2017a]|nr:hypothetical protein K4F52_008400 [Lecanicillium sp. MT-2017a]
MELSPEVIYNVLHPTAAFSRRSRDAVDTPSVPTRATWETSFLNPKNRINSLELPQSPLWRIDGCIACGTQYFAVPLFLGDLAPNRVDVFIPPASEIDPKIRDALDLNIAFHTRDTRRVRELAISRHLVRCLSHWTSTSKDFTTRYKQLPFGSRILFHNLPADIGETTISILPIHYIERQMLSVLALQTLRGADVTLPPSVDLGELAYLSQPHDSVSIVRYSGQTWIFKALTSHTKYLYHELRQLLCIPTHPSILSKPSYVVTKSCSFGSKVAIIGFLAEYHCYGSLRDHLPFLSIHNLTTLAKEVKWSLQITSAMVHLRKNAGIFYPDLRLDNIVLSESGDVIMVDFEQRGVWCEFAAPEVNAIEYIRVLATDDELPQETSDKYAKILDCLLPGWEDLYNGEEYSWPLGSKGYNIPWLCLTPKEQEACEVYMLGRVLWCIFEAKSSPQRAAAWASYKYEPLQDFPAYERTPPEMRELVDHCTRGRQPALSDYIVRRRSHLILRKHEKFDYTSESTPDEILQTARDWWIDQVHNAEEWLQERAEGIRNGTWEENFYNRPTLREVWNRLAVFYETCCKQV